MLGSALGLLAAAGCGGGGAWGAHEDYGNLDVEVPDSGELQYMAICNLESKALTGWEDYSGIAASAAGSHPEWHRCIVIWREKPVSLVKEGENP